MPLYNPSTGGGGTAGAPFFETKSGSYFSAPTSAPAYTSNVGVGYCVVAPIIIPAAVTVDRIGVYVTIAAATSLYRLGMYADDGSMRPGTRLFDAGTVDTSTTGFKEITISQSLSAGIYWTAAIQITAAATVQGLGSVIPIPSTSAGFGSSVVVNGLSDNGGNTTIPSTFTTTFLQTSGSSTPRVILRAA